MRSNRKLLLLLVAVLGIGALSAGLALASGGSATQDTTPSAQTDTGDAAAPGTDDDGAGEADDDDGAKDDDGSGDGKDGDGALTGDAAAKASDSALAATGGGTVTSVESDDGDAGYEVEVRAEDGTETEVELDKSFQVVKRSGDD